MKGNTHRHKRRQIFSCLFISFFGNTCAKVMELATDEKGYWAVGKWGGREVFNCVILSWNFWFLIQENSLSSILLKYKRDSL